MFKFIKNWFEPKYSIEQYEDQYGNMQFYPVVRHWIAGWYLKEYLKYYSYQYIEGGFVSSILNKDDAVLYDEETALKLIEEFKKEKERNKQRSLKEKEEKKAASVFKKVKTIKL